MKILKLTYGISDRWNNIELPAETEGYTRLDEATFYHAPRALVVFPNGQYHAAYGGTCQWVSDPLIGIDCLDWAVNFSIRDVTYSEVWALLRAPDFMSGVISPNREALQVLSEGLILKAPALRRNKEFLSISRWAKKALREMDHKEFLAREKARQDFLAECKEVFGVEFNSKDLNELRFIRNGGGLQFLRKVFERGTYEIPHSKEGFRIIYGEETKGVSYPRMEAAIKLAAKKRGLTPVWVKPQPKERELFSANIGGELTNSIPL